MALIVLTGRMLWNKLPGVYPYFFTYIVLDLFQTVVLSFIPGDSLLFRYAWVTTEGVIACSYCLVVLELYSVVLGNWRGLARLSRRYIKGSLAVAIAFSLLLLILEKKSEHMVTVFYMFETSVVASMVLFVLFMSGFLVYYPVPLSRNVVIYSCGYAFYFFSKATLMFWVVRTHHLPPIVNSLLVAISTACLFLWAMGLNRAGEVTTMVIGHRWNPGDDDRVLDRLRKVNEVLARTARK